VFVGYSTVLKMPDTRSTVKVDDRDENLIQKVLQKLLADETLMTRIVNTVTVILEKQYGEKIKALEQKVDYLERHVERKCEIAEQYTRLNNVRVFGVPKQPNEEINKVFIDLCKDKLNINLTENDIDCCHRLPAKDNQIPPIIVRFVRRDVKQLIYNNKKRLIRTKITIREDLTSHRLGVLKYAVSRLGNKSVWSNNGKIFVKINNYIHKIYNKTDLDKLAGEPSSSEPTLPTTPGFVKN